MIQVNKGFIYSLFDDDADNEDTNSEESNFGFLAENQDQDLIDIDFSDPVQLMKR